ncbi:hypothetical protein ACJJTC_019704 [Scirpophaga incertulas]
MTAGLPLRRHKTPSAQLSATVTVVMSLAAGTVINRLMQHRGRQLLAGSLAGVTSQRDVHIVSVAQAAPRPAAAGRLAGRRHVAEPDVHIVSVAQAAPRPAAAGRLAGRRHVAA